MHILSVKKQTVGRMACLHQLARVYRNLQRGETTVQLYYEDGSNDQERNNQERDDNLLIMSGTNSKHETLDTGSETHKSIISTANRIISQER